MKLNLSEITFIAILSAAIGIFWGGYSFLYAIISQPLKIFAINGLIEGLWQFAGVFFAYIIRKPGSAILGETLASVIEGLISQWGFLSILSGLSQGVSTELIFLLFRYKIWNNFSVSVAGAGAAIGGYVVTYFLYGYNYLTIGFNILNLVSTTLSGIFLGGILAKYIAGKLAQTGVLNQFKITQNATNLYH